MERFEIAVHQFFDPVLVAENMRCVDEAQDHVRFENEAVFLEVWFDWRRTREISLTIGRHEFSPKMVPFDLADVLRAYEYSSLSAVSLLRGSTDEAIQEAVGILARLTEEYALELLRNNREEFLYVNAYRKWASLKYAWERNNSKSVIVAFRSLVASQSYERVKDTFAAGDLDILDRSRQLSERDTTGQGNLSGPTVT